MGTTKRKLGSAIEKTFYTKFRMHTKTTTVTPFVFQATGDPYFTVLSIYIAWQIEIH
jgi:hypothetical protein